MANISYKVCTEPDFNATYDLLVSAATNVAVTPWTRERLHKLMDQNCLVVAKDGNKVFGFLAFEIVGQTVIQILLYVTPDYRRKRHGTALCDMGKGLWVQQGAKTLKCLGWKENEAFNNSRLGLQMQTRDDSWFNLYKEY